MTRYCLTLLGCIALSACTSSLQQANTDAYLTKKNIQIPSENDLSQCYGYGCKSVENITLSATEWHEITKTMQPLAKTPAEERDRLPSAIARFETIIGAKTGTDVDIGGTFKKLGSKQLDCVDESTNTTLYLLALQNKSLVRFHEIEAPNVRLPIIHAGRWPHQSAVIHDKSDNVRYAVDSWFRDNGQPADIVPLDVWKDGWKPSQDHDRIAPIQATKN